MISVNIITKDGVASSITGSVNGQNYGISYSKEKLDMMQQLSEASEEAESPEVYKAIVEEFLKLTVEDYQAIVLSAIPNVHYKPNQGTYHLQQDELILDDAMPQPLVDRLLMSVELGIPTDPLIRFYTRLLRNPFYSAQKAELIAGYINHKYVDRVLAAKLMEEQGFSEEVALERATAFQTPLTQQGLLATYKYATLVDWKYILDENGNKQRVPRYENKVTIDDITGEITTVKGKAEFVEDYSFMPPVMGEDGDAFFCDDTLGHILKVGSIIRLAEWSQVNTNDNASCVPGLHVGNQAYIRGYKSPERMLHEVFVDPMHIGAVVQGSDGALRVKQYFVYGTHMDGAMKAIYHSSDYAKKTDAEWEVMRKEAIEKLQAKQAKQAEKLAKLENQA